MDVGDRGVIDLDGMQALIDALGQGGRTVLGPVVRDDVVTYAPLRRVADLPVGVGDEQQPGHYRLRRARRRGAVRLRQRRAVLEGDLPAVPAAAVAWPTIGCRVHRGGDGRRPWPARAARRARLRPAGAGGAGPGPAGPGRRPTGGGRALRRAPVRTCSSWRWRAPARRAPASAPRPARDPTPVREPTWCSPSWWREATASSWRSPPMRGLRYSRATSPSRHAEDQDVADAAQVVDAGRPADGSVPGAAAGCASSCSGNRSTRAGTRSRRGAWPAATARCLPDLLLHRGRGRHRPDRLRMPSAGGSGTRASPPASPTCTAAACGPRPGRGTASG